MVTRGPILGTRITTLSPIDGNKTRIDVSWRFTPSGIPVFVHEMVKSEITRGTNEALEKIASQLELTIRMKV